MEPILEILRYRVVFSVAFGFLGGIVLSLVALLPPIWRAGRKSIIVSVSTAYVVAILCDILVLLYVWIIINVTFLSFEVKFWHESHPGGRSGTSCRVVSDIYDNRNALATELWNHSIIPHPQDHCFASNKAICDLPATDARTELFLGFTFLRTLPFAFSAALTCAGLTGLLIKKRKVETEKTPQQQSVHSHRRGYYLVIPLILIWFCVALVLREPGIWHLLPWDCIDASGNQLYSVWLGPWYSTLLPAIVLGVCAIGVIEFVLLALLKARAS